MTAFYEYPNIPTEVEPFYSIAGRNTCTLDQVSSVGLIDLDSHYIGQREIIIKNDNLTLKEYIEIVYSVRLTSFDLNLGYTFNYKMGDQSTSTSSINENFKGHGFENFVGRDHSDNVYYAPAGRCIINNAINGYYTNNHNLKKTEDSELELIFHSDFTVAEKVLRFRGGVPFIPKWVEIVDNSIDENIIGYGLRFNLPYFILANKHFHTYEDGNTESWYDWTYLFFGKEGNYLPTETHSDMYNNFFNFNGETYQFPIEAEPSYSNYTETRTYSTNCIIDIDKFTFETE